MAAAPVPPVSTAPTIDTTAAPMSHTARIINTFIAPSKTFTDLRRSASWWAPWLLISAFSLLFSYTVQRQITFDQITRNEIARSPKASDQFDRLSPEQQAQQMRVSNAFIGGILFASPAMILFANLIVATVLFATFKFAASTDVKFKTVYAITMFAGLPGIVAAILAIVTMFAGISPEGFNINNPVGTNPAHFMDPSGSKFVLGLASIPDVINIWTIVLLGIGFACTGKVKRSTAIIIVTVWYLVWKVGMAGLAAMRG